MSTLPIEVVLLILSFGTEIRMRNGKLMDQLQLSEEHAYLISHIPQTITTTQTIRDLRLVNFVCKVQLTDQVTLEKVWCKDANMFWWTIKRKWREPWASRSVIIALKDIL